MYGIQLGNTHPLLILLQSSRSRCGRPQRGKKHTHIDQRRYFSRVLIRCRGFGCPAIALRWLLELFLVRVVGCSQTLDRWQPCNVAAPQRGDRLLWVGGFLRGGVGGLYQTRGRVAPLNGRRPEVVGGGRGDTPLRRGD